MAPITMQCSSFACNKLSMPTMTETILVMILVVFLLVIYIIRYSLFTWGSCSPHTPRKKDPSSSTSSIVSHSASTQELKKQNDTGSNNNENKTPYIEHGFLQSMSERKRHYHFQQTKAIRSKIKSLQFRQNKDVSCRLISFAYFWFHGILPPMTRNQLPMYTIVPIHTQTDVLVMNWRPITLDDFIRKYIAALQPCNPLVLAYGCLFLAWYMPDESSSEKPAQQQKQQQTAFNTDQDKLQEWARIIRLVAFFAPDSPLITSKARNQQCISLVSV